MATAILKSKAVSATKMQCENTTGEPIKWTAKMLESFAEAKRGDVYSRTLNELLDV